MSAIPKLACASQPNSTVVSASSLQAILCTVSLPCPGNLRVQDHQFFASTLPGSRLPLRMQFPVNVWESLPGQEGVDVEMVIERPEKGPPPRRQPQSELGLLLREQRFPEPQYFTNVDCMSIPGLLSLKECLGIISIAESYAFRQQFRMNVQDVQCLDIMDPDFAQALWNCGLGWVLRAVTVDGMVPCGLNDVIRIQRFVAGGHLSNHIDTWA